jgi:hypothetical protein
VGGHGDHGGRAGTACTACAACVPRHFLFGPHLIHCVCGAWEQRGQRTAGACGCEIGPGTPNFSLNLKRNQLCLQLCCMGQERQGEGTRQELLPSPSPSQCRLYGRRPDIARKEVAHGVPDWLPIGPLRDGGVLICQVLAAAQTARGCDALRLVGPARRWGGGCPCFACLCAVGCPPRSCNLNFAPLPPSLDEQQTSKQQQHNRRSSTYTNI